MEKSIVYTSMRDDNDLECSYANVQKDDLRVILILKETECAVFDYNDLKANKQFNYLLLKHYPDSEYAYKDFLKLIGKMCKKTKNGKYFLNHIKEDNRMVYVDVKNEHMITDDERNIYSDKYNSFKSFIEERAEQF